MKKQIIVKENYDLEINSFKLHKTGLTPIGKPSFEQWEEVGKFIRKANQSVQFWWGDWLNYGESAYGQKYSQALEVSDFEEKTLRNACFVASNVEMSRRRDNLSFSHHAEVAPLEPKEQGKFLDLAEKDNLSVRELRVAIKEWRALQEGKVNPSVSIGRYDDNIFFISVTESSKRFDDHIITGSTYPTLTRWSRFYHPDRTEFSLREYAQVQDFPNDFKLVGTYQTIKDQIGNAVSPKMAEFIGNKLKGTTFVDLFAGCGGLSLGLEQSGKKPLYAIEREKKYANTYIINFPNVKMNITDIRKVNIKDIPRADIVVGGPPCQGFSTAGLRLKDDPRNQLYKEFLRIVKDKKPNEFLMENVPEISSIKNQVIKDFSEIDYKTTFELVYGPDIGMKQTRKRAFFIGKHD